MIENTNLKLSQGYEVLCPRTDKALPIPCNEWDVLKSKINTLVTEPWFFHTLGSILLGAALATAISVWTGAVTVTAAIPNALVIAWSVTAVCFITGLSCMLFAHKERQVHRTRAGDILIQMRLIEERFEREEI